MPCCRPSSSTFGRVEARSELLTRSSTSTCEWAVMSSSRVEVRELFESDDGIIAEVTIGATINGRSRSVEAAPAHRWVAGRLIRNRLYADPLPAEVWAVQPPAGTSR